MPEEVLLNQFGLHSSASTPPGLPTSACPDFHELLASILEYSVCYAIARNPEIIKFEEREKEITGRLLSLQFVRMLWPRD